MDKYIIELLKIESTVIIPGLGALMNGALDGQYVFNKYLKINDHKLEEYISKTDGVDAQEAANEVAKLVREINTRLDKGETYDIFGLGKFFKDSDGGIDFDGWDKVKDSTASKPVEKKEEKPDAKKAEKKPVVKKEVKAEEKKSEKIVPKKEEVKKAEVKKDSSTKVADKSVDVKVENQKPKNVLTPDSTEKKVEKAIGKTDPLKHKSVNEASKSVIKPKDGSEKTSKPLTPKEKAIADKKAKIEEAKKAKEKVLDEKMAKAEKAKEAKDKAIIAKKDKVAEAKAAKIKAVADKKAKVLEAKKAKSAKKGEDGKEGEKKGSKAPKVILILLVLIVAGGGTFAMLKWDMVKGWIGMEETSSSEEKDIEGNTEHVDDVDHEEELTHGDEVVEDTTNTEDVVEETDSGNTEEAVEEAPVEKEIVKEEPKVVHQASSGSYHIIIGGFSNADNANRLVSVLQGKGLAAQNLGAYSGLNLVSIKSFDSMGSAKSELGSFSSDYKGAWIFKKK